MIALTLANKILQLFLMMFCGWLLVKTGLLKSSDSKVLSILCVYIIIPCTVINAFQISYTPEAAGNFLLAVINAVSIHILLFLIVWGIGKVYPLSRIEKASLIYSNAGNLIIPLVTAVLGEDYVLYASAFMIVQLFIIWTHGRSLIEGKSGADFKAILTNVNLIACVLGLVMFLCRITLPSFLQETMKGIGSMIGPAAMIMIGMILAGSDIVSMIREKRIWIISFMKMILIPAAVILIMKLSGFASLSPEGSTILYISLMACMTPSAATVTQMAQLYDQDAGYATAINTITTLMCIATMPLLTMLYYL